MDKGKTKTEIFEKCIRFLQAFPESLRDEFLLTGGSAAFLFGSDRPFSDDIDFMVPKKLIPLIEREFRVEFSYHKAKPVFHSLKAALSLGPDSYDLIAESIVQPAGRKEEYSFSLTPEILGRKEVFNLKGKKIFCVPKEMLALLKLLAGRGKETGKYDLYDVHRILLCGKEFDYTYFAKLMRAFLSPLKATVPLILANAEKIRAIHPENRALTLLADSLRRIR